MALRPGGKVKRRQGPIGKPLPSQKPKGRPKPGSKPKGPAGGPKPKPSTIKPKLGIPPKMPVTRKAMGGEAREGVAKAQVRQRNKRTPIGQKKLMEMLERLYGKQKIVPKKKPKKDK
jgi:hypothetical protein